MRLVTAGLVSPPVAGAAYLVGIAAWAGTRTGSVDSDIGDLRRADAVAVFMQRRFPAELTRMKVGVIAMALALGLVLGLAAEVLLRARHPRRRLLRRSAAGALVEGVLLVAALHAFLVLWAMADTPQLYAAEWYAQGGWRRVVQLFATDWLRPRGVVLAFVLGCIAYVRPTRIAYLARRASLLARRPLRGVLLRIAVAPAVALAIANDAPAAEAKEREGRWASDAPAAEAVATKVSESLAVVVRARLGGAAKGEVGAGGAASRMNVLVLAADSLRADRVEARVAPNLVALAEKGTRFERAYISLPRTFPSWVSMLTGRAGHHHGIRSMFPTWEERAKDLDAAPARFAKAGYSTAVVSDYAGDIFGRVELGFETVDAPVFDFRQLIRQKVLEREIPLLPVLHSHTGRRLFPVMRELAAGADPRLLADDVVAALRARARRKEPFFVTAFFSAPHFPYAAPAPYYSKFTEKGYRGRFKYHKPVGLNRGSEAPPDADDIRQIRGLYDGTVAAVDDAIGRVLRALEEMGLAEKTILVVTADHGELLYDNGHGQGHGDHLFGDEALHVPLIVVDPRVKTGRRETRIVRDVDLAPSLYELAGVEPPSDLDGRSFAPALRGEPIAPKLAYAESELWFTEDVPSLPAELRMPYPGIMALTEIDARHNSEIVLRREMQPATLMARHRMVRDERWKLVYVPTRLGVKWMLFDTDNDKAEIHDVAAAHPNEVARLQADLWAWMLEDPQMERRNGFLVPKASP
ncbi:MAG: sulfatase [Labilithrix sp.]|nr:sulfatase [Labilithrix sp.]MCW5813386.1 sulfatase [Labilithrix sp.]